MAMFNRGPMTGKFSILLLAILCTACARQTIGHDMSRPAAPQIVLGKTTEANVVALYGQATGEQRYTRNEKGAAPTQPFDPDLLPGIYVRKEYYYVEYAGGRAPLLRRAMFTFRDDILISYNYLSDFPTDSTAFDERKVAEIVAGRTTRDDIVRLFGQPAGQSGYPVISRPQYAIFSYSYRVLDVATTEKNIQLDVLFSPDGVVSDYKLDMDTKDLTPERTQPGVTIVSVPTFKHR